MLPAPARIAPVALLTLTLLAPGCSVRRMALTGLADSLSTGGGGGVFATDDDPELVRDALPFSLKLVEALLVELPEHPGLLLTACSGFTQYAWAYPQSDAERVALEDYAAAEALDARAVGLYLRGRDYCLRALELRHPGVTRELLRAPDDALGWAREDDVPLLYWTGASWGGALALGLDRPELVADFPVVQALFARALELDEDWGGGAIHAAAISLAALPEAMGGSRASAREHFERAVALSGGTSAAPYVTYATSVARPEGDRAAYVRLLEQALAVDPDADPDQRLANHIVQRRARFLLDHVDRAFVETATPAATRRTP